MPERTQAQDAIYSIYSIYFKFKVQCFDSVEAQLRIKNHFFITFFQVSTYKLYFENKKINKQNLIIYLVVFMLFAPGKI